VLTVADSIKCEGGPSESGSPKRGVGTAIFIPDSAFPSCGIKGKDPS